MSGDDWITFYREADPTGYVISVNQSVSSGRKVLKHKNCYEIRLQFGPTQLADNGMPNQEGQTISHQIEDGLSQLIEPGEGEFVARRTGQEKRSLWLCGSNVAAREIRIAVASTRTISVALLPSSLSDVQALHPTELEGHLARDEDVLYSLAQQGDDHAVPRKIDYFMHGITNSNRAAIEARLRDLGFRLEEGQPDSILFSRVSTIKLDTIQRDTRMLIQLSADLGCEYDGWGTTVMRTLN